MVADALAVADSAVVPAADSVAAAPAAAVRPVVGNFKVVIFGFDKRKFTLYNQVINEYAFQG